MEKWEYKILEFETVPASFGGTNVIGKYVDYIESTSWTGKNKTKAEKRTISRTELLALFNNLGKVGWELVESLPIGSHGIGVAGSTGIINFFFKRQIGSNNILTEERSEKEDIDIPKNTYDVFLENSGKNKIMVIKILREEFSLGLREAKDLVDNTPIKIMSDVSESEAENIKTKIESVGGLVEIN